MRGCIGIGIGAGRGLTAKLVTTNSAAEVREDRNHRTATNEGNRLMAEEVKVMEVKANLRMEEKVNLQEGGGAIRQEAEGEGVVHLEGDL